MQRHDIGGGHSITWVTAHDSDKRAGIIDWHTNPEGKECGGFVAFEGHADLDKPKWKVVCMEPLTLSPSILCSPEKGGCGSHGFIREGRWVEA